MARPTLRTLTVHALRAVLAVVLAGTLFVQVVMVPLVAADLSQAVRPVRVAVVVLAVLGLLTVQVTAVCVWRLVTMVHRSTVFSRAAFPYVDVVIGAAVTASLVVFGFAVLLAPGEAAPGIVLLVCGVSVVAGGVALVVLVLRMLLAQAVDQDREARVLRAELAGVI